MKKLFFSLFILSAFIFSATAQKDFTEGHIRLEITEVNADDENMAAMLQMMKGSFSDFYFSYTNSLAIMNMMGGIVQSTTLSNHKTGDITMLFDAMGNKTYVESNEKERAKLAGESVKNVKVSYDNGDTREILGYSTKKATISYPGATEMQISAYVSPEIKMSNKLIQGMENVELEGFPLMYDIKVNGVQLVMEATKISKKFDNDVFDVSTEGHTKTTLEELSKSLGGVAGGMGF